MIRQNLKAHLTVLCSTLLAVLAFDCAWAQGDIKGFVYEEASGEAVIFTNVYLEGTTYGAPTDVNGYFSINNVPEGEYTLVVSYLGYETLERPVSVQKGKVHNLKLFLKSASVNIQAVEVSAERQERQNNVTMSVTKATPKEIKQIPSVGGSPDLAQYLQVLPGVVFTGDQGGQLYIRGGSPIQNKVLLDGMTIYNPFHSIGLFSVFDTEILRNADIYTGGFGAEYGGRISSVMDIRTRDGNKRRVSGNVGINSFAANAMIEGPLIKQTNEGNSSISYVLSARHSYLDETSKMLYGYVDEDGLPFAFTDLYGKISFATTTGSKFNVFGFNFQDRVNFQSNSQLEWNSFGTGLNFVLTPENSSALMEGGFNLSNYDITLLEESSAGPTASDAGEETVNLQPRTSGVNSFNIFMNFKYFFGENELKYGIDITNFRTELSFFNPIGLQIDNSGTNTELVGFGTYKWKLNDLILDMGLRLQYYGSIRTLQPEPRIAAKYNLTETLRFKFAGGLYSQNLISANSDRDVVNLFYGFLVGPEDLQNTFVNGRGKTRTVDDPLQKAGHLIVGTEYDFNEYLSFNVEAYYKRFFQLTNMNRNKLYRSDNRDPNISPMLKNDFIVEDGEAMGLDFTASYESRKVYIWAVYSLSKVDRWDGLRTYYPIFDRRHNVNLLASYRFGKNLDWEVNGRWNYGSGFPFTQSQGYYLGENLSDGFNTDITETNASEPDVQYGPLNEGRLPDYHRFDLTVKRTFRFSEHSSLEASVSVTNLYDRQNIFYLDRLTGNRVDQLPILPSAGLIFKF